jgi:hypothetical protein
LLHKFMTGLPVLIFEQSSIQAGVAPMVCTCSERQSKTWPLWQDLKSQQGPSLFWTKSGQTCPFCSYLLSRQGIHIHVKEGKVKALKTFMFIKRLYQAAFSEGRRRAGPLAHCCFASCGFVALLNFEFVSHASLLQHRQTSNSCESN